MKNKIMSMVLTLVFAVAIPVGVFLAQAPAPVEARIGQYVVVTGDGTIGYWKNKGQLLLTLAGAVFLDNFEVQLNRQMQPDGSITYTSVYPFQGMFNTGDLAVFKAQVRDYLSQWPRGDMADKLRAQYLCYLLNARIGYIKTVDFCNGLGWYYWDLFAVQAWQTNDKTIMEQYKNRYELINSNNGVTFGVFAGSPNWYIWFPLT